MSGKIGIYDGEIQLDWFSYYWHRFNKQFFSQLISNVNRLTAHAEKNLIKDLKLELVSAWSSNKLNI